MDLSDAAERIREGIRRGALIIVIGLMEVVYEGRAASTLGPGERLLIIKQDGSLLVHRPIGYEPVNWQPPGSRIDVILKEGELLIEARRVSPQEILRITFHEIREIAFFKLRDEAEFAMYATEEDMKRAILLEPSIIEKGFRPIEDERKVGESGFIDIFGVDSFGNLVIIEIKRRNATASDIRQLVNYVEAVEKELGRKPRAIIAAPGVQRSAVRELKSHGVEFRCLSPRKCHEILQRYRGLDKFLD